MLITTLVVIPVVRATFRANQSRGFFRFTHARIKEYAEAIVFYGGQQREGFAANENFVLLYADLLCGCLLLLYDNHCRLQRAQVLALEELLQTSVLRQCVERVPDDVLHCVFRVDYPFVLRQFRCHPWESRRVRMKGVLSCSCPRVTNRWRCYAAT